MFDPFILMCAPNGARRQKKDHVRLPLSPAELVDCAEEILAAGASVIHLHVRDEKGQHSLAPDYYRPAIQAIRDRVGQNLIIQITTEAVGQYSREEQLAVVKELRPEAVSLALREICPSRDYETDTITFYRWMMEEGIWPQTILYDQQDTKTFLRLHRSRAFAAQHPFVLCVLGRYGKNGEPPDEALKAYAGTLNAASIPWAVCGFGSLEHTLAQEAALLGGHVRVGFENNLHMPDGTVAPDNAELIRSAAEAARKVGRRLSIAQEIRQRFALPSVTCG